MSVTRRVSGCANIDLQKRRALVCFAGATMISETTYRIIHLIGLAALAVSTGGMLASEKSRRTFAMVQGLALLVVLVTGFGMLAQLHLGFPHFAMVKILLWVFIGMLPVVFRKMNTPVIISTLVIVALIGVAAWLGVAKPALW
jgi:hypothetical protein